MCSLSDVFVHVSSDGGLRSPFTRTISVLCPQRLSVSLWMVVVSLLCVIWSECVWCSCSRPYKGCLCWAECSGPVWSTLFSSHELFVITPAEQRHRCVEELSDISLRAIKGCRRHHIKSVDISVHTVSGSKHSLSIQTLVQKKRLCNRSFLFSASSAVLPVCSLPWANVSLVLCWKSFT